MANVSSATAPRTVEITIPENPPTSILWVVDSALTAIKQGTLEISVDGNTQSFVADHTVYHITTTDPSITLLTRIKEVAAQQRIVLHVTFKVVPDVGCALAADLVGGAQMARILEVRALDPTIPVLHFPDFQKNREEFLADVEKACHEVGFFALTGTGVDPAMLDRAYKQVELFFKKPLEEKMALRSADGQRGYSPGESAKGEQRVDYKEFYHVGRDGNVWSEEREYREAMEELYRVLDQYGRDFGEIFSHLLRANVNSLTRDGASLMRSIHYHANSPEGTIWGGAHTDINLFTILPRSSGKGLQVLNTEGEWVDVLVPDGAFIINCGDMLENVTNGYYRSATHRIIDPRDGRDRYSIVFFVHPRGEVHLDPSPQFIDRTGGERRYANVTAFQLLSERLIDLGLAGEEMQKSFVASGAIDELIAVGRFSEKAEAALIKAGLLTP